MHEGKGSGIFMGYFDDIEIHNVAEVRTTANLYPRKSTLGAIGIMLEGPVLRRTEKDSVLLEAPFLYWCSAPTIPASWSSPPRTVRRNLWFCAAGPRFERMIQSLNEWNSSSGNIIPLKDPGPLTEIFERMKHCYEKEVQNRKILLGLLAEELMATIEMTMKNFSSVPADFTLKIRRIAEEIRRNPGVKYNFASIAEQCNISEFYFRRSFTKICGFSPYHYLLNERYALAVKLLRETSLQTQEIAELCGFPVSRAFSVFFKQRSGMTPRQFRKSCQ